nr:hypothetical protein [uncultured Criibacterium sp.]
MNEKLKKFSIKHWWIYSVLIGIVVAVFFYSTRKENLRFVFDEVYESMKIVVETSPGY